MPGTTEATLPDGITEDDIALATGSEPPVTAIERKKPGPKPKPKGPRYEHPTLGRIIHVVTDMELALKLNCEHGIHCAAIVTDAGDGRDWFAVHVYSPSRNPDVNRYVIFDSDGEAFWHWPEKV